MVFCLLFTLNQLECEEFISVLKSEFIGSLCPNFAIAVVLWDRDVIKMATSGDYKTSKNFFNLDASEELGTLLDEIDAKYGETMSRDLDYYVTDDLQARMPEIFDEEKDDIEPTEGLTVTHLDSTPVNYFESPAASLTTYPVVFDELISFSCKCDCINKFDRTLIIS